MDGYLLDTNTIRFWFDGEHGSFPGVQAASEALRGHAAPLYVSVVTLGEIQYGHSVHPAGAGAQRDRFLVFVRDELPQVLNVTRHTAEPFGLLRAQLFDMFAPKGQRTTRLRPEQMIDPASSRELGIQENDLWIAAQAIERNLVLVTHDGLARIRMAADGLEPPLHIEDWTESSL